MIKLIATDLDGTLATHKGEIPPEAFPVIRELEDKGIVFAVATGRQAASVENDFREVLDAIYVVAENGAVVKHAGEYKHVTELDQQKIKEVIQLLESMPDAYFMVCCKDKAYQNRKIEHFDRELDKYYHEREYKEDLQSVTEPIVKVAIYHPEDVRKEIEGMIRTRYEEDFKITISGVNWLDIGSHAINKGKAIEMLQQDLGIAKSESMAFGDYFNDVEMFGQVEYSYVMSHAIPEVKTYAKYEVPTGQVLEVVKKVYSS